MTTKPNEPEALEPCPFCGAPLFFNGNKMNPYGRCETEGCWMHDRKCTVPTDDPWQVGQWNRRVHAQPVADACGVTDADREAAAKCVEHGLSRPNPLNVRQGVVDSWHLVQAFARHRLQSVAAATAAKDAEIMKRLSAARDKMEVASKNEGLGEDQIANIWGVMSGIDAAISIIQQASALSEAREAGAKD
jgi:hypothetical protein